MRFADAKVAHKRFSTATKVFTHMPPQTPGVERIDHEDIGRRYHRPDGRAYKSVTTELKPMSNSTIRGWRQNETIKRNGDVDAATRHCDRHSQESIDVGNALHAYCEEYLNNRDPVEKTGPFEVELAFNPWRLFECMKANLNRIDNIRGVEFPVYDDDLRLAGTIDCAADWDGEFCIIDHKNARTPRSRSQVQKYFMQGSLYAHMWEKLYGERPVKLVVNMAIWNLETITFVRDFDRATEEEAISRIEYYRKDPDYPEDFPLTDSGKPRRKRV